jgi:uncharacterized delta-60 repeat protein
MRKIYLLFTFFVVTVAFGQNSTDIINDFSFPGLPANHYIYRNNNDNSSVSKVAIQPDGKIIINSGNGLERIDNNLKDHSFSTGLGFARSFGSYAIDLILVQQDGKILVKGNFDFYNGIPVKKLIRLNSNGDLDYSFNVDLISAFVVQPDGKVIVSGNSSMTTSTLFRFNSNGELDTSFNSNITVLAEKMFMQSDGKLLVASQSFSARAGLKRYNDDGSEDITFSTGTGIGSNAYIKAINVQRDGKIIIAGSFIVYNGITVQNIVRLNNDGVLDSTFSTNGTNFTTIQEVIIDFNEKILVGASEGSYFSSISCSLVRLNTNGSIDPTFNIVTSGLQSPNPLINGLALQNDGKIIIARNGNTEKSEFKFEGVGRLNSDGSIDNSFNYGFGFNDTVNVIHVQSDRKILIGGSFSEFRGELAYGIIRLNEDYTRDLTFNIGGCFKGSVNAIAEQPDGKILIGGRFSDCNGNTDGLLMRLNIDGSIDNTFTIGRTGPIYSGGIIYTIVIQPDGKILAGGGFQRYANIPGTSSAGDGIVRLNNNGTIDTSFNTGAYGFNGSVFTIALESDGKIHVGGDFTTYQNSSTLYYVILNPNASGYYWNSGANTRVTNKIYKIIKHANGSVLCSTNIGLNILWDGITYIPMNCTVDGIIRTMVVQPDNNILIGGDFTKVNNIILKNRIARVSINGVLDMNFDCNNAFNNSVKAIGLASNGNVLVGGDFTSYKGTIVKKIVCLKGDLFYNVFGNNKFDINENGCDINDVKFPFLKYNISNGTVQIPNSLGSYSFSLGEGTHIITPFFENPNYFIATPSSITVDFPSQTSPFMQNFCITPNGIHPDLEVVLIPIGAARPGFDAKYKLVYKNKGNQLQSGSVSLNFDDAVLDYVSAAPVASTSSTNVRTWNFTNLNPYETREVLITLNLNTPVETPPLNGGSVLNYTTTISSAQTDETPNDNTFTLNQTVVNSYDPNDKTCTFGPTVGTDKVGEYAHYVIRFENSGTYNAQNINVTDVIDTNKFDINTLVPLSGSALFTTKISGGNKVEFKFDNINLPYTSGTNTGYVAFKIKTKSTLVAGDTFGGLANIYFDYNYPITTNTYTTTIQALSTQDFSFGNYFSLYPNPVSDVLNINKKESIEISSIYIYNVLGQLMMVVPNAKNSSTIDVSNLSSGNYFVKVNSDKGTSNTKFIKK